MNVPSKKLMPGLLGMVLTIAACGVEAGPTQPAPNLAINQPTTTVTVSITTNPSPVPNISKTPAPSPTSSPGTVTEYSSGALWLRLFTPQDEQVVTMAQITVEGQAPAETVIGVNDQIAVIGSDQSFSIPVILEEGPNVIEIIASDVYGNEIDLVLTVVYDPQGES
jgi:hypothetical protein